VLVRGWTETAPLTVAALLERIRGLPLAAVLVTDVAREGQLAGADTARFAALAAAAPLPLIASGGITTDAELRALADAGVAGAVLGMALYTGALEPRAVAREFRS
jgi:phosphoribosylformimino-5-aminoimidazole carboxamide ribotide isomerase